MTKKKAQAMVTRIRKAGGEARLYENYSGRGMFGKTTTGVVMDWYSANRFGTKCSRDSMGKNIIVY